MGVKGDYVAKSFFGSFFGKDKLFQVKWSRPLEDRWKVVCRARAHTSI